MNEAANISSGNMIYQLLRRKPPGGGDGPDDLRGEVKKNDEDIVTIRLCGSGFLYNMVRIIAGTLLKVGTGEWEPEHVKEVLEARNRKEAGQTAPAKG